MRTFIVVLFFLHFVNVSMSHAQYGSFDSAKTVKPFKIFDNLFYVGIDMVSAYLLVTDKGIILIGPCVYFLYQLQSVST